MQTENNNIKDKHVEELSRKIAYEGAIVDFYDMEVELPDGKHETWDLVHHRKGAACVLPVLDDGRLLMVRQFRPALGRFTLEVPAGARDSLTEDPKITATRELEEETGYACGHMEHLLSLKTTVAFCDESIEVYLARDLKSIGKQNLDEAESIEICKCSLDELVAKIYAGEIQDSKTVSAIMTYAYKYKA